MVKNLNKIIFIIYACLHNLAYHKNKLFMFKYKLIDIKNLVSYKKINTKDCSRAKVKLWRTLFNYLYLHIEYIYKTNVSSPAYVNKINHDISLRGKTLGEPHFLTLTYLSILKTLKGLGFNLVTGPEVEHCLYNFDKLNISYNHISRSISDTFYLKNNILLRTHTSSIQSRILRVLTKKIPIRIISYGKVFRKDADKTHSPMFHQLEGLYINKHVGISELKGTLVEFIHKFFEKKIYIRWRSSFFPFTEPSCELDIQCLKCKGSGCPLCKKSGWIELMGAGLVNPIILENAGINSNKYSGYAFGLGIERFSMMRYELDNIKNFTDNILQEIYIF